MNNFLNKTIVLVAPEQYSDLARRISHEISKKEGFNSSFWTVNQFVTNEISTSSNQYVIFIGNTEENEFTKTYLPVIKSNLPDNKAGIFYGFDGTKAIVYGDGNLKKVFDFRKLYKAIKNGEIKVDGENSNTQNTVAYIASVVTLGFIGLGLMKLFMHVSKTKKEKKFRKIQTELALALFITGEFNRWFNIKTEAVL
jgi:hypothetical protein